MSLNPSARALLRLDARRVRAVARTPRAVWGGALPALVAAVLLWRAGAPLRPDAASGQGRILLGMLAAAVPCLAAYPLLFGAADEGFLRRLGAAPGAVYAVRALRLTAASALGVAAILLPYRGAGGVAPLAMASAAAALACGWSLAAYAGAARAMVRGGPPTRGGFDPELAAARPLVFAPLAPLVGAVAAARFVGAGLLPGDAAWRVAAVIVLALAFAWAGARRYADAAPRFSARAAEMRYVPSPSADVSDLVIGRGLAAVLPRRAGAVRARDSLVVRRRFRWAGRLVAPFAIVAVLALLRAADVDAVRQWVAAGGAALLAAQGLAVIGLGRAERRGPRWLDRAAGISWADRLLGRVAALVGLSLGFIVPVGIVWAWTVPRISAWWWPAASLAVAALAAVTSLMVRGWK